MFFALLSLACVPKEISTSGRGTGEDPRLLFERHLAAAITDPTVAATYTSAYTHLTMDVPNAGIHGEAELWMRAPDDLLLRANLEGLGMTEQGYVGGVAWAQDQASGPRVLTGPELAEVRYAAHFAGDQDFAQRYSTMEFVGSAEFDGRPCFEVFARTPDNLERNFFFAQDDGLMIGITAKTHTIMGPMPTQTMMRDYQDYGAVKQPRETRLRMMGMEQVLTIDRVEWNPASVPDFAPPPDIQALLDELNAAEGP